MEKEEKNIIPLKEYPRPQFKRDSYFSLNGIWDYSISKSKEFLNDFEGEIVVPYCIESELSNVQKRISKDDYIHYRKMIEIPKGFNKGKVLINFGAVDQISYLYVNRQFVGEHKGGYIPFSFDITKYLNSDGKDEIYLIVKDDVTSDIFAKGKQYEKPYWIYYTPVSGIWQSVFLESVPDNYIKSIDISLNYDKGDVSFSYKSEGEISSLKVEIIFNEKVITTLSPKENNFTYHFDKFESWSVENPNLYDVKFIYQNDEIKTYFGMRKISIIKNKKDHKLFALNNKPILLKGVLDQGYFKKGIYTPSSYEELKNDIVTMKDMGFNMLRKHIKIELPMFYYYCDKLGMVVLQDFVSGGEEVNKLYSVYLPGIGINLKERGYKRFGRGNIESRKQFEIELKETYEYLKNSTCICGWTIFNEAWGQFDSVRITESLKSLDSSRFIDSCSGWQDQKAGDCYSKHIYFKKLRMKNDKKRVAFLSEFGGYSLYLKDHAYSKKEFGYKKFKDSNSLFKGIESLYLNQLKPLVTKISLGGFVYTQLSDVEIEVNGFLTYDREVNKVNIENMKKLNDEMDLEFENSNSID